MKVFQLYDNPYSTIANPYISTLMDGVQALSRDILFGYGKSVFWSECIFDYDIIHIHWPDVFLNKSSTYHDFEAFRLRLESLKSEGVKIITTCHNLEPHYSLNLYEKESHGLVYGMSDVILHMGLWSLSLFEKKYPHIRHILIPHHTYDTIYSRVNREKSVKKLNLNPNKKYVLCFGAFRSVEERELVDFVVEKFYDKGVEVLAPHYLTIPKRRNLIKRGEAWLRCRNFERKRKGLHIYGWYVSHEMLPLFYGASDISLIQRKKILNSGNLPMGFYMGKVVVGPDVGNVGQILKDCKNPVFSPENIDTLYDAINDALLLSAKGKGDENRLYAENCFSTKIVSEKLLKVYLEVDKLNG